MSSFIQIKSTGLLVFKLIVLAIGTVFLFYSGPDYAAARSIKELWNLGHIGYFALLIFLLARIPVLQKFSLSQQWIVLLLFSLLLGTVIEVLQYGTSRIPDVGDISRDMAGALLGLAFHPQLSHFTIRRRVVWMRGLALLVLLVHLAPLVIALSDEAIARKQFPVLSDFSTPFETGRWGGGADRQVVELADGSQALKIDLKTTRYSGVGMDYLAADWRGYQTLNLALFNPDDESLRITLRVHDRQHEQGRFAYASSDRFNRSFILHKGWNKISVPLAQIEQAPRRRRMDMAQIADVSFFVSRLRAPRVIYLERIYLL